MSIEPADMPVRMTVFEILSAFENNLESIRGADLRDRVYETYQATPIAIKTLGGMLRSEQDIDTETKNIFLYLEPPDGTGLLPLVTIRTSEAWIHFRIYTRLYLLDGDSKVKALGIRFETDEGEGDPHIKGAHDFCHAQLFSRSAGVSDLPIPSWLPVSQPSFPLDADDQVSLVLCMLTTLYGGAHVLRRLREVSNIGISKHLNKVRALRGRSGEQQ